MASSKAFLVLALGFVAGVTVAHFFFSLTVLAALCGLAVVFLTFAGKQSAVVLGGALLVCGLIFGYVRANLPSPSLPESAVLFSEAQGFLQERIEQSVGGVPQAMFSAMVLGYKEDLSENAKEVLNATGTRHVVAISGLHMTIVGVIIFKTLIWLGLWRRHAIPVTLLVLALYVLLVGAPPSAIRAGLMAGLYLGAGYGGRLTHPWRLLLIAAVLMLLFQPGLLFEISFQLSFAAVLGIIFFKPFFDQLFAWLPYEGVRDLVSVSSAAQLTTWPLIAHTFEQISFISPVANLVAVPLLPLVMMLGVAFMATAWAGASLAQVFIWPAWILLKVIYFLLEYVAGIPYSAVTGSRVGIYLVVFYYVAILYGYQRVKKMYADTV